MEINDWKFSTESESRLKKICLKLGSEKYSQVSNDWLALFNHNSFSSLDICHTDIDFSTDVSASEEEICNLIKEALQNGTTLSESTFVGISVNSLSRILVRVKTYLDEFRFCSFCKFISSWNNDFLIEHSMRSVVYSKLKETPEASGLVINSIKDLAFSKPGQLCQYVFSPLLSEKTFTDIELLKAVFPVLPAPQRDLLIMNFTKKSEFTENDWFLLHPLIKDLSQSSLLNLLNCIQKSSYKFTKSQIFGKLLVNFCKNLDFIGNMDILREVIENHQTLLKTQAMKYLDLV